MKCFRSPFLISQSSSHGRYLNLLTERLTSCSDVNLRIAGGISVNLLFRRLRTFSESNSKSSLGALMREFPARKTRRKGLSEE